MKKLALLLTTALCLSVAVAAPAGAKLGKDPSDTQLASEFLRVLQTKSQAQLAAFLHPAFLLQRPDGSYLTKAQYLKNPSVVESFKIKDVHGTRSGNVRVIRYTAITKQTIDGKQITNEPVPRLSTYVRNAKGVWQIIAHANFSPIPKS